METDRIEGEQRGTKYSGEGASKWHHHDHHHGIYRGLINHAWYPHILVRMSKEKRCSPTQVSRGTKGVPRKGGLNISRRECLSMQRIESKPLPDRLLLTTPPLVPSGIQSLKFRSAE